MRSNHLRGIMDQLPKKRFSFEHRPNPPPHTPLPPTFSLNTVRFYSWCQKIRAPPFPVVQWPKENSLKHFFPGGDTLRQTLLPPGKTACLRSPDDYQKLSRDLGLLV